MIEAEGESDGSGHALTALYGRSGPDVRSIVVVLADGRSVTADVATDGWWSAWWPGDRLAAAAIRVTTTADAVTTGPFQTYVD